MSKRMPAEITCSDCRHKFQISLYRTIWIEEPINRKLVFEDKVNAVKCAKCGKAERLRFPLLCTNVKEHIAVWYEPYHDPVIDDDMKQYATHFGAKSFYATAPRIRDWEEFKAKIIELEQRTGMKPGPKFSPEMGAKFQGFINSLRNQDEQPTHPVISLFTKDNIVFHGRIALLAPAVFFPVAQTMWELTGSAFLTWIPGLAATAFAWSHMGRAITWVSAGANIPVASKDQRGIERLGFVIGLIAAPIAAIGWHGYAKSEFSSPEPAVFFTLPATIAAFLLAKILVRTSFWIRDGFNSAS